MGQVEVSINGKPYRISCDDGEEQRIDGLARIVDGHVADLVRQIGQVGDSRLLLMAALLVADELMDLRDSARMVMEEEAQATSEDYGRHAAAIEALAAQIENIAAELAGA